MKREQLNLQETADFIEQATIEQTVRHGPTIAHFGRDIAGNRFILLNDWMGETVLMAG